jgi:hypothetical protein
MAQNEFEKSIQAFDQALAACPTYIDAIIHIS